MFLAWSPLGIVAAVSLSSFGLGQLGFLQIFLGLRGKRTLVFRAALFSTPGEIAGVFLRFHLSYAGFYTPVNILVIPAPRIVVSGDVNGSVVFYRRDEGPDRPVAIVDYKTRAAFVLLSVIFLWLLGVNTSLKKFLLEPILRKCGNQALFAIYTFDVVSVILLATNYVPLVRVL